MGLLPPPTVAHHLKGSPDGQQEVLEEKASCCQGCLFFHFFTHQAVSPYWVQGQACPEDTPGRKLTHSRLPPGMMAGMQLVCGHGPHPGDPARRAHWATSEDVCG